MGRVKDIILNPNFTVVLGDSSSKEDGSSRRFKIRELPIAKNEDWSARVLEVFDDMLKLEGEDMSPQDAMTIAIKDNPRSFIELVYDYSDEIAQEREWVENNATPTQMFELICTIMEKALPFLMRMNELTPQK